MQLRSRSRPNTPAPASAKKPSRQHKSAKKNEEIDDDDRENEDYTEHARKSLAYDDLQQVPEEASYPIVPETPNPVRILTFSLCWSALPLICLIIALYVGHATVGVVLYQTRVNVTSTSLPLKTLETRMDTQPNETQMIMDDLKKLETRMTRLVQDQSQLKEQQRHQLVEDPVTITALRSMVEEILVDQQNSTRDDLDPIPLTLTTPSKDLEEVRHNISLQQHMLMDLNLRQTEMTRNVTNQLLSITQQNQKKQKHDETNLVDLAHHVIGTKVIFRPEELSNHRSMFSKILCSIREGLVSQSSYLTSPTFFSSLASAPSIVVYILALWKRWTVVTHGPERALVRGHELGDCWAFPGSVGQLSLAFPYRVRPTAITLEHVSSKEVMSTITAPRHFEILGLNYDSDRDNLQLISYGDHFTYAQNEDPAQTFDIPSELVKQSISGMMLKIHDNYGSSTYTCLYRFRVHGDVVES